MNLYHFNKFIISPPSFLKKISKDIIWERCDSNKNIWLTFDDGPETFSTNETLDVLKDFNVKGTFFLQGSKVVKNPKLFDKIKSQNHSIGNHTFSHLNGWTTPSSKYFFDVEKADKIINSKLFRPPFGKITFKQIKELKNRYKIIMWSIMPMDFSLKLSYSTILNNILNNIKNGSIIVLHCNSNYVKDSKNLSVVIKFLLKKGFKFSSTW